MPVPVIELQIGSTYTDITSYVMTRGSTPIQLTWGQTDENSVMQPSSCTFLLNNRDGRFTPRNPTGPYYGLIGRNSPIRVSVVDPTGGTSVRFWGEVPSWPQNWDTSGNDIWVEIEAASVMRRLGQNATVLRSTLFQGYTSPTIANPPVAYWPCEDASGATQIASATPGGTAMAISGAATLATYTGFDCSDSLPTMGAGSFTGVVGAYTYTGFSQTRVLLAFPVAGSLADKSTIFQLKGTGTAHTFEVYYNTGGGIGLRCFDHSGTNVGDSTPIAVISGGVDGQQMRFSLELTQSGSNINYTINLYVPQQPAAWSFSGGALVTGYTMGSIQQVNIAPSKNQAGLSVGHITVQTVFSDIFDLTQQVNAYNNEAADVRARRLLGQAGVATGLIGIVGDSVLMGTQHPGALLELLQDCVDADGGTLYDRYVGLGIGFRGRAAAYSQSPSLVLDYAASHLAAVPKPIDDDRFTINTAVITRTNGSSATWTVQSGTLSVQPPPLGVGPYDGSTTINVASDATLLDQAGWRTHVGTTDLPRYPQLTVNLARAVFAGNSTLTHQVLNVRPGSRIQVLNPPVQAQADYLDVLLVGGTESIDQFEHVINMVTVPYLPYLTAKAGDGLLAHCDTDGSTIASPTTSTQTTISIATTDPTTPVWSSNQADYPFDLLAGGERMMAVANGTVVNSNSDLSLRTMAGWAGSNATAVLSTAFEFVSGYGTILVTPNGTSPSGGLNAAVSGAASVTAAATYLVGGWVYCPAGWTDVQTTFDAYNSSGVFLSTVLGTSSAISAGTWTYLQQTLTAPASSDRAVLRFRFGSTPASSVVFYVASLTMVPTASVDPTSPQLMTVVRSINGVVKPHADNTNLGGADGSFESGLTGWTPTAGTLASTSTSHSGTHAGLLTVTGSPTQTYVRTGYMQVVIGQSYTCTLWTRQASGTPTVGASIDWFDASHAYLSTSAGTAAVVSTSYVQKTVTGTAPASAAYALAGPTIGSSPATGTAIDVDDVTFGLTAGEDIRLFTPMTLAL